MAVSKAQQKATAKYIKINYDRIEIKVPKGQKQVIQTHAQSQKESLNGFVNRSINETIIRDKNKIN